MGSGNRRVVEYAPTPTCFCHLGNRPVLPEISLNRMAIVVPNPHRADVTQTETAQAQEFREAMQKVTAEERQSMGHLLEAGVLVVAMRGAAIRS